MSPQRIWRSFRLLKLGNLGMEERPLWLQIAHEQCRWKIDDKGRSIHQPVLRVSCRVISLPQRRTDDWLVLNDKRWSKSFFCVNLTRLVDHMLFPYPVMRNPSACSSVYSAVLAKRKTGLEMKMPRLIVVWP